MVGVRKHAHSAKTKSQNTSLCWPKADRRFFENPSHVSRNERYMLGMISFSPNVFVIGRGHAVSKSARVDCAKDTAAVTVPGACAVSASVKKRNSPRECCAS